MNELSIRDLLLLDVVEAPKELVVLSDCLVQKHLLPLKNLAVVALL